MAYSGFGRGALAWLGRWSVLLVAALWFVAALITTVWMWGLDPLVFPAADESVVHLAATLIAQKGQAFLRLPFPDPEDLAHPRAWLSVGNIALPTYAPVTLYGYGLLLKLGDVGLALIAMLPASGVAAFAAGTARLLPVERRWLALLAPSLGFASLYWLLRPWMNLSPLLVCLCWAFLCWSFWRNEGSTRWLAASLLCVGVAAGVRPDYAGFLLLSAAMLFVASRPSQWKQVGVVVFIAGVLAVVPNLILNKLATGHPLVATYQLALDRQYGTADAQGVPFLGVLRVLFAPMGLPTLTEGTTEFKKYFVTMRPATWLVLGQVAILPLLFKKSAVSQALYLASVAFAVFFIVTHLHSDLFGGAERLGFVSHSVPRYLAPIFLFAPLPPLLLLGSCRRLWLFLVGAVLCLAIAGSNLWQLYVEQPASLSFVHDWVRKNEALLNRIAPKIPKEAMVYSATLDKILWSRWRVGWFSAPEAGAASMARAVQAGLPVFVLEPNRGRQFRSLSGALKKRGLLLANVDPGRGLYRLDPAPPSGPAFP